MLGIPENFMRLARAFAASVCLAAAALAGCGLNPSGDGTGTTMRVVNLIPGSTSVTVTVGNSAFMTAAPFQAITPYQGIPAGGYTIKVNLGGNATPAFTATTTLLNVSAYSFLTFGAASNVIGLVLSDTVLTNVPAANFALSLANASPTAGAIDVYLTAPGADLSGVSPILAGVVYQGNTNFVNVPVGNYQLRVTRSGTKEVIFDGPMPAVAEGSGQAVVAYSRGSSRLVNVLLLTSGGAATYIDNRLAQLKAVNASSVASPLNVFVDGTLTLANIPYTGASNYQRVASGTRAITVEASATPGAALLTTSPNLVPATDTSMALYGSAGALSALVLTDSNVSTVTGQAQVRIVNVSPDLASIDVYANQALTTSGVAMNSASSYALLNASVDGTDYQFDFNLAGTATPVLTLPKVTLTLASVYTIYVMGPANALQAIVVQDF
jgi:hypothetical protein